MKPKRIDAALVVFFPVLATFLTLALKTNFLVSILLFFGLPSAYLAIRNRGILGKSVIFAFCFGTIFWLLLDPLATINGAWIITGTVFPIKIFGIITIENYIFALLWTLYATIFYEHFFDRGRKGDPISPRIRYPLYLFSAVITIITMLFYAHASWLYIPYFYLSAGLILAIIPLIIFLCEFPFFLKRFFALGAYFAFLLFLFEIAALRNGQWSFPGNNFIGSITLFGCSFPLEELLIWIVAATPGLISYYEFFADDRKAG